MPTNASQAAADTLALHHRLVHSWRTQAGVRGWLSTVDHKAIGIRYLVTALLFLILGGLEALALRLQLAGPEQHWLTPQHYNELFTLHGMTMIFLYAMPVLSGMSNYLWPLMLGARDMAFPRLNAFSYWVYLFAGLFLYASVLTGAPPDDGWFNYVPYATRAYNPGPGIDIFALGMVFLGISTTAGAINFIVTLARTKAPGMSIDRVPIIVWGTLTASVGNVLAVPAVSLAFFLLWLDREFGTRFYDTAGGGHALLWQHLFWMFGHPWVYALVLPAMGIVSDALPVFCRRPLVGYVPVALSTVATMFIGFGVWVHHMFATGLPPVSLSFFSAASIIIVIPSAVAVFAWIATMFNGQLVRCTPFYFFAGFVFLFTVGGVSGFMTASVPLDWQLTDTYFVVAHLHYVLLGINVFPVMGGIYFWFPKMSGKMLDDRLGKWNFWVMFIGFNLAFFPMHVLGLLGMPRRIYTYPADMGWEWPNLVTSIGSFVFALGVLLFLANIVLSLKRGKPAGPNPWDAPTLEWSIPSPPPPYNFLTIPALGSGQPLWETRLEGEAGRSVLKTEQLLAHGRQTPSTSTLEGTVQAILTMPGDTVLPLACTLALCALFVGALLQHWWLAGAGTLLTLVTVVLWLWPAPGPEPNHG
jgi:cytochrome c oxidase subunit I+III